MATMAEKMAASLEELRKLQEKDRCVVLQGTAEIGRTHLTRLLDNGWLQEVMKGWYIAARPGTEGDTTVWYTSFWLDPTRGGEMAKTRPCVVVTPSDLNMYLTIVVIAPITSTIRNYPYRVLCSVAGRDGEIATDQIRTVDKSRLKRKIGDLNFSEIKRLKEVFHQMFCE